MGFILELSIFIVIISFPKQFLQKRDLANIDLYIVLDSYPVSVCTLSRCAQTMFIVHIHNSFVSLLVMLSQSHQSNKMPIIKKPLLLLPLVGFHEHCMDLPQHFFLPISVVLSRSTPT